MSIDLSQFEFRVYSQNGEDGIIQKLFQEIGTTTKYFIEFGVESGGECNTRYLRENCGWTGLMMDGLYRNERINLQNEIITAENINSLFLKYNVPYDFDLLSIDIDYNDFYIWNAISNLYRPRVVVIEYNATHLPFEDKIVVYDPNMWWDGTNYFGASCLALFNLARHKGYSLIYAENAGVNLFFIRDDVLSRCKSSFKDINCVDSIYKCPRYGQGPNGGHVADPAHRQFVSSKFLKL